MITKIVNGQIVTSSGIKRSHLYLKDDKILALTNREIKFDKKIDATNCYVFPGLIDAHVHLELQQGKYRTSDDFENGTKIALSSGITTVIDYLPFSVNEVPNKDQWVNYSFHKVITKGVKEDYIKKYIKSGIPSFKIFTTYSKNGWMLNDGEILDLMQLIKKNKGILEAHCENDGIIVNNEKKLKPSIPNLPLIHEPITELEAIHRLAYFAKSTGVHLHIVHTTLYKSMTLINSLKRKQKITFETCPQYLFLDSTYLKRKDGPLYTCNPPLRDTKNCKKLFKAFLKHKIDILTTDHCSFTKDEKMRAENIFNLPFGIPSLGYSFLLMLNIFDKNKLYKIVRFMGTKPAEIFRISKRGDIKRGNYADIVIVSEKALESMGKNGFDTSGYNPYGHIKNKWEIQTTFVNGKLAYNKGKFLEKSGQFIKRF
ncbi:amidohydrolase family protein [bacterium]|nr:amidohydrolase family protein [bacterium]